MQRTGAPAIKGAHQPMLAPAQGVREISNQRPGSPCTSCDAPPGKWRSLMRVQPSRLSLICHLFPRFVADEAGKQDEPVAGGTVAHAAARRNTTCLSAHCAAYHFQFSLEIGTTIAPTPWFGFVQRDACLIRGFAESTCTCNRCSGPLGPGPLRMPGCLDTTVFGACLPFCLDIVVLVPFASLGSQLRQDTLFYAFKNIFLLENLEILDFSSKHLVWILPTCHHTAWIHCHLL
jgi:hypothetical protein